jgi:hypothetical protein
LPSRHIRRLGVGSGEEAVFVTDRHARICWLL